MKSENSMNQGVSFLTLADRKLAYQHCFARPENGRKAGIFFLGGFASDMSGTKASFLHEQAEKEGLSLTRFDYRGHGVSSDRFEDGCIGDWFDDALKIFDALTDRPQILVGSSMGGWIGLLLAKARAERVAGFVGVAAAPDFTEELLWPSLTPEQKKEMAETGRTTEKNVLQGQPIPFTRRLIEDGKNRSVFAAPPTINGPVHLVQGQKDIEVPWRYALRIAEALGGEDVRVTIVKDGDHRMSRKQDLDLLWTVVGEVVKRAV